MWGTRWQSCLKDGTNQICMYVWALLDLSIDMENASTPVKNFHIKGKRIVDCQRPNDKFLNNTNKF